MGRADRVQFPGAIYHIMVRGNNGRPIVHNEADRLLWYQHLAHTMKLYHIELYAHVLMTNHYHLLLITPRGNVAEFMRVLNTGYVQKFKRKHRRHRGHLFQGRYLSPLVQKEVYFLAVVRYIHHNPRKPGLVRRLEDYRWSSYGEYLGLRRPLAPLEQQAVRDYFSRDFCKRFAEFHQVKAVAPKPKRVRGVEYYGDDAFGEELAKRVERRKPGRSQRKQVSLRQLEKKLEERIGRQVKGVIAASFYAEREWRGRIVYLARSRCGSSYREMSHRWGVKEPKLAQIYRRYVAGLNQEEERLLKELENVLV